MGHGERGIVMSKTFIREIPIDKMTDEILKYYEEKGFTVEYTDDSVVIWAE